MISRWLSIGAAALATLSWGAGCEQVTLRPCQPGATMTPDGRCVTGGEGGGGSSSTSSGSAGASASSSSSGGGGCDDPQVAQGQINIEGTAALVPLCGGRVLLGDVTQNQLVLRAVAGGAPQSWPLSATPGDIAYDAASDVAFVALSGASKLARISLSGTGVEEIALSAPAVALAVGSGGGVFAVLHQAGATSTTVSVIEGSKETALPVSSAIYGGLLAYDAVHGKLFVGDAGSSPSGLSRYAWDAVGKKLTLEETRDDAGTNGQGLTVSPDGAHLAFPCGGGNAAGYTISDYDPLHLTASAGEWDTGAYPTSASFSPDSKQVLATNGTTVQVFDVASHAMLQDLTLTGTGCSSLERVAYSPGGHLTYAVAVCGGATTSGRLFWWTH